MSQEARTLILDAEILQLIVGYPGGRFNLSLGEDEKAVLRAIRYCRGIVNAINIRQIQAHIDRDVRVIKKAVRTLRMDYRIPIGSSKHGTDGGYYLIVTEADRAAWVKDVLDQVRAELAVLRAAAGHQAGLELLGQLHMEAMNEQKAEAEHA
jgi:hypothetical protein